MTDRNHSKVDMFPVRAHNGQHAKIAGLQSIGLGITQTRLVQICIQRRLGRSMTLLPWDVVGWVVWV